MKQTVAAYIAKNTRIGRRETHLGSHGRLSERS
ncbi:Uncharacterised protein [Escherichia coli]|nr:Uncharacterised protein [Escherichia coli]